MQKVFYLKVHRIIEFFTPSKSEGLENGRDGSNRIAESWIVFIQVNCNSKRMI